MQNKCQRYTFFLINNADFFFLTNVGMFTLQIACKLKKTMLHFSNNTLLLFHNARNK